MIGTNLELDRDTSKKNMAPKVSDGFINGKLYVGKNNENYRPEIKKTSKRVDYKVKKIHSSSSEKSVFSKGSDKMKKNIVVFTIVIVSVVVSVILGNIIINRVYADGGESSSKSSKSSESSTSDPLSLYERVSTDGIDNNSDDLDIPNPILSEVLGEDSSSNLQDNQGTMGNSPVGDPSVGDGLSINDVPLDTGLDENVSGSSDVDEYGDNTSENVNSSNTPSNGEQSGESSSGSEEAIYYYAKKNGEYGLVGFPLRNNIKSMNINEKINLLANELLKNPKGSTLTMIPDNTKFLGFKLINNTLYLNFSDEFNYNIYGVEGDIQQIAQIVYTFTSLRSIDRVSFMIDGNYPSSVGSHGIENRDWTEEEIASLM